MCVYIYASITVWTRICIFFLPVEHNGRPSNEVIPDQSVHVCLVITEGVEQAW